MEASNQSSDSQTNFIRQKSSRGAGILKTKTQGRGPESEAEGRQEGRDGSQQERK